MFGIIGGSGFLGGTLLTGDWILPHGVDDIIVNAGSFPYSSSAYVFIGVVAGGMGGAGAAMIGSGIVPIAGAIGSLTAFVIAKAYILGDGYLNLSIKTPNPGTYFLHALTLFFVLLLSVNAIVDLLSLGVSRHLGEKILSDHSFRNII